MANYSRPLNYSARTGRKIIRTDRSISISPKRDSRGIMLICSSAVHGAALKELGFRYAIGGQLYWPAAKAVNGRIPGEAGEYVARFGVGRVGA